MLVFVRRKILILFCFSLRIGKDCLKVDGASSLSSYGVYSSSSSSYSIGSGGVSSGGTYYYHSTSSSLSGKPQSPAPVSISPNEPPSQIPSATPSSSTKPTAVPTPLKVLEASTSAVNANSTTSVFNRTKSPTKQPTRTTITTTRPHTSKPTVHPTKRPSIAATTSPTTSRPQTNKPTIHPTKKNLTDAPTMSPTIKPSTAINVEIASTENSNAPTPAESCTFSKEKRQRTILKILTSISPSLRYDEETITNSPQYLAANWIMNIDSSKICPTNKHDANEVIQRYTIALIYYSLDGSSWLHCRALNNTSTSKNNEDICQDKAYQRILSGSHECNWYGMKCNSQGFLTRIKLDNNNLSGEIPTELAYLTNLTHIDLGSNQISGKIPESLATSLNQLQVLDLHSNNITGSVPNNFGSLTMLKAMYLENNRLTGTMPDSVCDQRSRKLQRLSADCNPMINVLDDMVINGPIQCPCCTQCFPQPSTVASSSDTISQFSNISCSGEETYDDSMAPSVFILYLVYKVESVNYLGTHVDVAVENALAQYLAKSVLSCYWANHTEGQPFQISAYPPDALKDTCIARNASENCVLIHGFMSVQSSPGESLALEKVKNVVANMLSADALNLPITLSSSGENVTVRVSYFQSTPRSPFTSGNALNESPARSSKSLAKNVFLSVVACVSLLGLLALLGMSMHRRSSSNHRGGTTDGDRGLTAELSHDSKNMNNYDTVLSPEIQFVDGDVLSVSDLGFSQRSITESSVAWAFPNDDPFCKKATFVELEPADFHPSPLYVANSYGDKFVPNHSIHPLDSIDFNVIHQCPAWCQTDGVAASDLRSINESEMGDSFQSSDFENTVII